MGVFRTFASNILNFDTIRFSHAIWHVFVVIAAGIHFHSVYTYLIGSDNFEHVSGMTKMRDVFGSYFGEVVNHTIASIL
jgi:hypothetical protein